MGSVQEMKIDNKKEIYDSLVQSFENEVGKGQRKKIAKCAQDMLRQLKGKGNSEAIKEYVQVLNQIVKDFSKKQTTEEIQKEIDEAKWSKKR